MTQITQTLADFLLARLDEDEQIATAAGHGCGYLHEHNGGWVEVELPEAHNARPVYEMRFIKQFDPDRVLAECAAKREVVRLAPAGSCESAHPTADAHHPGGHDSPILLAMARVYADHPDFDPAWR